MRSAYKILAYAICALVAIQAALMAWAVSGLAMFLEDGGVLDLTSDGPPPFPEVFGVILHGLSGMYLIPLLAVVLVIFGLLTKVPGAAVRAVIVLGLVALQVTLGLMGHGFTFAALLHGLNALVLFTAALYAGVWMSRRPTVADQDVAATPKPMASGI